MKPERSELVMIEDEGQKKTENVSFTQVVRTFFSDLLECAFTKLAGFVTRLWTSKVGGGRTEGGEGTED